MSDPSIMSDNGSSIKDDNGHMDEAPSEDPCPVCLSCRNNESGIDGCTHTFCFSCISEWLKVSESCPLCKAPVTEVKTSANGKSKIIKISELKAAAEAARIMAQASEVPMTSEREAVTQLIHYHRAELQKIIGPRFANHEFSRINELYRKKTSLLNQLQALKEEMDRLPRRDIMGDIRFREVVYEQQLIWKPISRPSTAIRFNCAVACSHPDTLIQRLKPFLMRELKVVLIDKWKLNDNVINLILTSIQNHEINNPNFEMVLFNMSLFNGAFIGKFSNLLYEFCASGLELAPFDANSTYSLDPSRAPSGRLIPNLLPVSSRTNDPIFIDEEEEDDDDDVIIDGHRSDSSSSDGVHDLYNHRACRIPSSSIRSDPQPLLSLPFHRDTTATLQERLQHFLPSFGLAPLAPRTQSLLPNRHTSRRVIREPEVISLEDESTTRNQARINTIPRRDLDSTMGDPSWLNVTGEWEEGPSTSRGGIGAMLNPLHIPLFNFGNDSGNASRADSTKRRDSRKRDKPIETSWREEKGKKDRRQNEEKKDEEVVGVRIGSRRNSLSYFYNKMNGRNISMEDLQWMSQELGSFSDRILHLKNRCNKMIEEKNNGNNSNGSSNSNGLAVVELDDDDIIHMQEDQSGPSNVQDDSILILQ
ncbi:hypothetical protein PENTCL1PPCAC_6857 [Pristionchus entomophagus]|uniref:RING-type E3 ubiquitin transferase n=1 Tax=Pristionchus entomophagus TaxID=358040 RepID=A0AAV5SPI0_9BILA|nr:hypothetical protein PENTCL1PPCAC_6857 [Pristionchus entomophagus]